MENRCDKCGKAFRGRRYLLRHKKRNSCVEKPTDEEAALTGFNDEVNARQFGDREADQKAQARNRSREASADGLKVTTTNLATSSKALPQASDIDDREEDDDGSALTVPQSSLDQLARNIAKTCLADLTRYVGTSSRHADATKMSSAR